MPTWVAIFIAATALAVVLQTAILAALFIQLRRGMERTNRILQDFQARVGPILTRVQILLEDTQPRISEMVSDAAHVVYLARAQAQKVDRIFSDATDRLRNQLLYADRILTGALETVENVGSGLRRNVMGPVQKASALVQGIKVGLDFFRSRRKAESAAEAAEQDDELFI
ncbi:MAG TPA: DUF948 domain-containing protein [Methylomirabilota bacterium]|jgi:hypothetical protein|nr:DUF948 domain-containing protein [Methylomirabilota bacterium]